MKHRVVDKKVGKVSQTHPISSERAFQKLKKKLFPFSPIQREHTHAETVMFLIEFDYDQYDPGMNSDLMSKMRERLISGAL